MIRNGLILQFELDAVHQMGRLLDVLGLQSLKDTQAFQREPVHAKPLRLPFPASIKHVHGNGHKLRVLVPELRNLPLARHFRHGREVLPLVTGPLAPRHALRHHEVLLLPHLTAQLEPECDRPGPDVWVPGDLSRYEPVPFPVEQDELHAVRGVAAFVDPEGEPCPALPPSREPRELPEIGKGVRQAPFADLSEPKVKCQRLVQVMEIEAVDPLVLRLVRVVRVLDEPIHQRHLAVPPLKPVLPTVLATRQAKPSLVQNDVCLVRPAVLIAFLVAALVQRDHRATAELAHPSPRLEAHLENRHGVQRVRHPIRQHGAGQNLGSPCRDGQEGPVGAVLAAPQSQQVAIRFEHVYPKPRPVGLVPGLRLHPGDDTLALGSPRAALPQNQLPRASRTRR
mmetsp:Transcript_1878/g.6343  ORF Transcript_1878/g.6343 Transcript_1878/m.6343 type:complete len:396 (+) Transcript_1878:89-1276(+)